MAGHSSNKSTKETNNGGSSSNNSCNDASNNRQHQQDQQQLQLDIDGLAREKVQEVELKLDSFTRSCSSEFLTSSLSVLKQIITAADLHRTNDKNEKTTEQQSKSQDTGESIYADFSDDNEQFNAHADLTEQFATKSVKWTIRVQAFKLVHRLVQNYVDTSNNTIRSKSTILKHLPDLIRLSFVAATSPYDELKMQGFEMFRYLIEKFSHIEEKEFAGHSILEQYKTQVLSAVKPAFNPDAPPYITAIASQICSLWICQGLEKDLNDVKRAHQLMLLSIEKLEGQSMNRNSKLYTESELEQERVDILGAWAQLYSASRELELINYGRVFSLPQIECDNLYSLVRPQIELIVDKWWEALKDYALLIMPAPRMMLGISSHDNNDNVYTREVALKLFEPTWPKLILATTIWLCKDKTIGDTNCQSNCDSTNQSTINCKRASNDKYAKFISGVIMKELCRRQISVDKLTTRLPDSTIYPIRALNLMLTHEQIRTVIINDMKIAQELYTTLYSVVVSYIRDTHSKLLCRTTLDLMFKLIVDNIKYDIKSLHFGLVKLVGQLMDGMKDIEIIIKHKQDVSELDGARMHLSIILHNFMSLIKVNPKQIFCEPQLLEAVIIVFQELLNFHLEPNFILVSIEQLNELYCIIPEDNKSYFILGIFKELCKQISKIFKSLYNEPPDENDRLRLSMWDSLIKSTRTAIIVVSDGVDRSTLINDYVTALFDNININEDLAEEFENSKRKRDLLDASLNQLNALQKVVPTDAKSVLHEHVRDRYIAVTNFHIDIKAKLESKLEQKKLMAQQSKRVNSIAVGPSARPQKAKITLKSDFSNFYSKKT